MRQKVITIVILSMVLALFLPLSAIAQDKPDNYVVIKMGVYNPTGELDDDDFDGKENAELMFGHYFNPNFALEGGIGIFINEWKEDPVEIDIDTLMNDCFNELEQDIESEVQARGEDDFKIEHIEANEIEFLENGQEY